jgi:hypothetical protein
MRTIPSIAALLAAPVLVVVMSCDESNPAVDASSAGDAGSSCEGVAPPLSDCIVGDFFANCGGKIGPVLGCEQGGSCRWFENGCVADGFVASTCPSEDVCCIDNWPYPDVSIGMGLWERLYGLGQLPWDADRAVTVSVGIDDTLTAPTEPSVLCTNYVPANSAETSPCFQRKDQLLDFWQEQRMQDTLVLGIGRTGFDGWWLWAEPLELPGDSPIARVCQYRFTDTPDSQCPGPREIVCAVSGSIAISRRPGSYEDVSDLVVEGSVTFPGAVEVAFSF